MFAQSAGNTEGIICTGRCSVKIAEEMDWIIVFCLVAESLLIHGHKF
jgi:hypothetical protein